MLTPLRYYRTNTWAPATRESKNKKRDHLTPTKAEMRIDKPHPSPAVRKNPPTGDCTPSPACFDKRRSGGRADRLVGVRRIVSKTCLRPVTRPGGLSLELLHLRKVSFPSRSSLNGDSRCSSDLDRPAPTSFQAFLFYPSLTPLQNLKSKLPDPDRIKPCHFSRKLLSFPSRGRCGPELGLLQSLTVPKRTGRAISL